MTREGRAPGEGGEGGPRDAPRGFDAPERAAEANTPDTPVIPASCTPHGLRSRWALLCVNHTTI